MKVNPMNLSQNVLVVYYFNDNKISCIYEFFPVGTPNLIFLLEQTDKFFTSDKLMYSQNKCFVLIAKTWISDAYADIVELFIAQLSRANYFLFIKTYVLLVPCFWSRKRCVKLLEV